MAEPFGPNDPRLGVAAAAPTEKKADEIENKPPEEQPLPAPKAPRQGPNPMLERQRVVAQRLAEAEQKRTSELRSQLEQPGLSMEQQKQIARAIPPPNIGATTAEQEASIESGILPYPDAMQTYEAQFRVMKAAEQAALRESEKRLAMLATHQRFSLPNRMRSRIEWYNGRPIPVMVGETREDAIERELQADSIINATAAKSSVVNIADAMTFGAVRGTLGAMQGIGYAAGFKEFEPLRYVDQLEMDVQQAAPGTFVKEVWNSGALRTGQMVSEQAAQALNKIGLEYMGEQATVLADYLGALRKETTGAVLDGFTSPAGLLSLVAAVRSPIMMRANRVLDYGVMRRAGQISRALPTLSQKLGVKATWTTVQEAVVERLGVKTAAQLPRTVTRGLQEAVEAVDGAIVRDLEGRIAIRVSNTLPEEALQGIRRSASELQALTQEAGSRLPLVLEKVEKPITDLARAGVNVVGNVMTQPFMAAAYALGGDPDRAIYELGPGSLNAANVGLMIQGAMKMRPGIKGASTADLMGPALRSFRRNNRILGHNPENPRTTLPAGDTVVEALTTALPKFVTHTVDVDATRRVIQDKIRASGDVRPVEVLNNMVVQHQAFLETARDQPMDLAQEAVKNREAQLADRLALMADLTGATTESPAAAAIMEKIFDPDAGLLDPIGLDNATEQARALVASGEIQKQDFPVPPSLDNVGIGMVNHPDPVIASLARWQATNGLATYVGKLVANNPDPRHALEPTEMDVVAAKGRLFAMHPDKGWVDVSETLAEADVPASMDWEWIPDKNSPLALELVDRGIDERLEANPVETIGRQPQRDLLNYRAGVTSGSAEDNLASLAYEMSSPTLTPEAREGGRARLAVLEAQHTEEWVDIRDTLNKLRDVTSPVERVQMMGQMLATHLGKRKMLEMTRGFIDTEQAVSSHAVLPSGPFDATIIDRQKNTVGRVQVDPRIGAAKIETAEEHFLPTVMELATNQRERANSPVALETTVRQREMLNDANENGEIRHATFELDGKTYSLVTNGYGDVAQKSMPLLAANEGRPPDDYGDDLTVVRSKVEGIDAQKETYELADRRRGERRKQYSLEPDWVAKKSRELVAESEALLSKELPGILREERMRTAEYADKLAEAEKRIAEIESRLANEDYENLPPYTIETSGSKQILAEMGRSLHRALTDSNWSGPQLSPHDLSAIARFIDSVGPDLFKTLTLRIGERAGTTMGAYEVVDDRGIATVFGSALQRTLADPERTMSSAAAVMAHEMWHHLSRALPTAERVAIEDQFTTERARFMADNPHLDWLTQKQDSRVGLPTVSEEEMVNVLSRFPNVAESHFAEVVGHPSGKRYAYLPSPDEYRFLNLNEYFAESMMSRMIRDAKAEYFKEGAPLTAMQRAKNLFGKIGEAFMRLIGRLVRKPDRLERVYRNFMNGRYAARQPETMLGAADRAFQLLSKESSTLFSRLLRAAESLPDNFSQKAQWIKGQIQGKGMLMGNSIKWQEAKDCGFARALEADPNKAWTKDDLLKFLQPRVIVPTLFAGRTPRPATDKLRYTDLKQFVKDARKVRRENLKHSYTEVKTAFRRLKRATAAFDEAVAKEAEFTAKANKAAKMHDKAILDELGFGVGPLIKGLKAPPAKITLLPFKTISEQMQRLSSDLRFHGGRDTMGRPPVDLTHGSRAEIVINEFIKEHENRKLAEAEVASKRAGLDIIHAFEVKRTLTDAEKARRKQAVWISLRPFTEKLYQLGFLDEVPASLEDFAKLLGVKNTGDPAALLRKLTQVYKQDFTASENVIRYRGLELKDPEKFVAFLRTVPEVWAKNLLRDYDNTQETTVENGELVPRNSTIEMARRYNMFHHETLLAQTLDPKTATDSYEDSSPLRDLLRSYTEIDNANSQYIFIGRPDYDISIRSEFTLAEMTDATGQPLARLGLPTDALNRLTELGDEQGTEMSPDLVYTVENGEIIPRNRIAKQVVEKALAMDSDIKKTLKERVKEAEANLEYAKRVRQDSLEYRKKMVEEKVKDIVRDIIESKRKGSEPLAPFAYGPNQHPNYWLGGRLALRKRPTVLAYGVPMKTIEASMGAADMNLGLMGGSNHYQAEPTREGPNDYPEHSELLFHALIQDWGNYRGLNEAQSDWQQQVKSNEMAVTPERIESASKVPVVDMNLKETAELLVKNLDDSALLDLVDMQRKGTYGLLISELERVARYTATHGGLGTALDAAATAAKYIERLSDGYYTSPPRFPRPRLNVPARLDIKRALNEGVETYLQLWATSSGYDIEEARAAHKNLLDPVQKFNTVIDKILAVKPDFFTRMGEELTGSIMARTKYGDPTELRGKQAYPPILEEARRLIVDAAFVDAARHQDVKGVFLNSGLEILRRTAGLSTTTIDWTWDGYNVTGSIERGHGATTFSIRLEEVIHIASTGQFSRQHPLLTEGEAQSLAYAMSAAMGGRTGLPTEPISGKVDGLTKRWPLEVYGASYADLKRVFPNAGEDILRYAWDHPSGKTSSRFGSLYLKKAKELGLPLPTMIQGRTDMMVQGAPVEMLAFDLTPEARQRLLGPLPVYAENRSADDGNRGQPDARVDAKTQLEETGGQTLPSDTPDWVHDMHADYEEGRTPNLESEIADRYKQAFRRQLLDPTRTVGLPEGGTLTVASPGTYLSALLAQKILSNPALRSLGETLSRWGRRIGTGQPLRIVYDPTPPGRALGFHWQAEANEQILYLNLPALLGGRYEDTVFEDHRAFQALAPVLERLGFDIGGASADRVNAFRGMVSLLSHELGHVAGAGMHGDLFTSRMVQVLHDLVTTSDGMYTLRHMWALTGALEAEALRTGEASYSEGVKRLLAEYNHPNDVVELPWELVPNAEGKHARRGAGDDRVRLDNWIRKQRNTGQADAKWEFPSGQKRAPLEFPAGREGAQLDFPGRGERASLEFPGQRGDESWVTQPSDQGAGAGGRDLAAGGINRLGQEGPANERGGEGGGVVRAARNARTPDELRRDALAKLGGRGLSPAEYGALSPDGSATNEQLQHYVARLAAVLRDSSNFEVSQKRLRYMEPDFDAAGRLVKGPAFASKATKIVYSPEQQAFLKDRWRDLQLGLADFWDAHSALEQTLAAKRVGARRLLLSPEQTLNLLGGRDLLQFSPDQIPEILKGLQSQEAVEQLTVNLIKAKEAFNRVITDQQARLILREGQLALNQHINEGQGQVQESFINSLRPLVGDADTPLNRFIVRIGAALDHGISALRGMRIMLLSPSAGVGDGKHQATIGTAATYAQSSRYSTDIHSALSKAFHGFRTELNNVVGQIKPVLDLLENDPALDAVMQKALGFGYDADALVTVGENRTFQLTPPLRKAMGLPDSMQTITTAELVGWFKQSFFPAYIQRVKEVELADQAQHAAINARITDEIFRQIGEMASQSPDLGFIKQAQSPEALLELVRNEPERFEKVPESVTNAIKQMEFSEKLRAKANDRRAAIMELKAMERENYAPFLYLHRMLENELSRDLDDIYSGDRQLSDDVRARFALHRKEGDFPFPSLAYGLKLYIPTMLRKIHLQPALRKTLPIYDQLPAGSPEKRYVQEMLNIAKGQITWFDSYMNNLVAADIQAPAGRPTPGKALAEARTGVDIKTRERAAPTAFRGKLQPVRKLSNFVGSLTFMGLVNGTSLAVVNLLENILASARFSGDGPLLRTKARGWDGNVHKVGGLPALLRLAKSFAAAPISMGSDMLRQWYEHRGQSVQYSPARASGAIDMYNRLHADYLRNVGNVDLRKALDKQDPQVSKTLNALWSTQYWATILVDRWSRYGYFNAAYQEFRRMGASEEQAAEMAARLTKREYASNYAEDQSPYFQNMLGRWATFLKKFGLNRGLSEMLVNDLGAAVQAREMGLRDSFIEHTTMPWKQRFKDTFSMQRQTPDDDLAMGRQIFLREAARRGGSALSMLHFGNTRAGGLAGGAGVGSIALLLGGMLGGPAGLAAAGLPAALATMLGTPTGALKKMPFLSRPGEVPTIPPGFSKRTGSLGQAMEVALRHGGLDESVLDDPAFFKDAPLGRFSQAEQEAYKEMVVELAGMVGADQPLPNTAIEAARRKTTMNVFSMAALAFILKKMGQSTMQAFPFLLNLSMVLYERAKEMQEYGTYALMDALPFTDEADWSNYQRQRYKYLKQNAVLNMMPFGSSLRQWRNDQLQLAQKFKWRSEAMIREQNAFQLLKSLYAAKGPIGGTAYMLAPTISTPQKQEKKTP